MTRILNLVIIISWQLSCFIHNLVIYFILVFVMFSVIRFWLTSVILISQAFFCKNILLTLDIWHILHFWKTPVFVHTALSYCLLLCESDAYLQSKLSLILAYGMAVITHEIFSKSSSSTEQMMSVLREFQFVVHPTLISYSKTDCITTKLTFSTFWQLVFR